MPNICITKNNRTYWNERMKEEDKYYVLLEEYIDNFDNIKSGHQLHRNMFTIHDTQKRVPLKKYLIKIVLDNPGLKVNDVNLYEHAKGKLVFFLENSGIEADKLEMRRCSNCYCGENYRTQVCANELKKLFI